MTKSRREKLVGSVVSLPTFTDDDHNLLLDRERKHIRWLIDNGIKEGTGVLLIAGGYGESYLLEDSELFSLIDVLVDEARGEVPTMVGIFDMSARIAARKARYAGDAGIDFIELGLPHYSLPSEEDVFLHHEYVSDHADVGIMSYNNFWVMPPPSYEITSTLMERFKDVENMVGFKWSSATKEHYLGMLTEFKDSFNFIDNGMSSADGARNGMSGFVDFYGNVAPRLSAKLWELFKGGRYDELDELMYSVHGGPQKEMDTPDAPTFSGMGDGPFGKLRWELMGLHSGPVFPAQATPSAAVAEHTRKIIEKGGLMEWVDWDISVVE
jgi:4-hydroxy-tetrahydrodipicolinate synthase